MFRGMRIVERISLRYFPGKYRRAEGAPGSSFEPGFLGLPFLSVGSAMPAGLKRFYGKGHLHFITFSCYRRLPLLKTVRARDVFVKELGKVRDEMGFHLVGYVVMPEHVHLLMSEPKQGTPSTVLQKLKLRVARRLRKRGKRGARGRCTCRLVKRESRSPTLALPATMGAPFCERFGRRGFTISMCTARGRRPRN